MDELYLPPSLRYFQPLRSRRGPAAAHVAFEYDLVAALRPRMVVDVGAGAAVSFGAFCQSMRDHDVDGLGYAIDAFADDAGKSEEDDTSSAAINNFLHAHFRGISYLLKVRPEAALQHFAEGSVDLLRIDAVRVGEPLAALLQAWGPKIARGGVLLCGGALDPSRPDVHADLLAHAGAGALVLGGGTGLGVHRVRGHASPDEPELLRLVGSSAEGDHEALARYYAHAARHHALREEIRDQGAGLFRKKAGG
jgi:hypothetical protein